MLRQMNIATAMIRSTIRIVQAWFPPFNGVGWNTARLHSEEPVAGRALRLSDALAESLDRLVRGSVDHRSLHGCESHVFGRAIAAGMALVIHEPCLRRRQTTMTAGAASSAPSSHSARRERWAGRDPRSVRASTCEGDAEFITNAGVHQSRATGAPCGLIGGHEREDELAELFLGLRIVRYLARGVGDLSLVLVMEPLRSRCIGTPYVPQRWPCQPSGPTPTSKLVRWTCWLDSLSPPTPDKPVSHP